MKNKEDLDVVFDYFQNIENEELEFDNEAILDLIQKPRNNQSLTIKVLSVFGGFLASLAFVGFLSITSIFESDLGSLIFGIICIGAGIFINKEYDQIMVDTISVSAFIIGFILLGFGLNLMDFSTNTICLIFIIIASTPLFFTQNYVLSFIAVFIINGSILSSIISNKSYEFLHIYISILALSISFWFLNEAKIISKGKIFLRLYNPVKSALIFSFLSGLLILGKKNLMPISNNYTWLSSIFIILSIKYLISKLFEIINIIESNYKSSILVLSVVLLLPTIFAPGISGAVLIILVSFLVNFRPGLTVGIISLLYFLGQYYYDLNFTLLTKSIILFSSGILFICLYIFTHKKLKSNEQI